MKTQRTFVHLRTQLDLFKEGNYFGKCFLAVIVVFLKTKNKKTQQQGIQEFEKLDSSSKCHEWPFRKTGTHTAALPASAGTLLLHLSKWGLERPCSLSLLTLSFHALLRKTFVMCQLWAMKSSSASQNLGEVRKENPKDKAIWPQILREVSGMWDMHSWVFGSCLLIKGVALDRGRKPQNISELNQVRCAAGTMVHGTAFPNGSLSLEKSRSKLFHSCSAIGSETHCAVSSVSTLELQNLCIVRAQKLFSPLPYFISPFAIISWKSRRVLWLYLSASVSCVLSPLVPGDRDSWTSVGRRQHLFWLQMSSKMALNISPVSPTVNQIGEGPP